MIRVGTVGRELALKALFAQELGKVPPDEALDGAKQQAAGYVQAPIRAIPKECRSVLRKIIDQRKNHVPDVVLPSLRGTALSAMNALRLVETAALNLSELSGDQPAGSHGSDELSDALRLATGRIDRAERKEALDPLGQRMLIQEARESLSRMNRVVGKYLPASIRVTAMSTELFNGVLRERRDLLEKLTPLCNNWPPDRQSNVDRLILLLSAYELEHVPETPTAVIINEAVEMGKKYSTPETSRFINGVLGALAARRRAPESRVATPADEVEFPDEAPDNDEPIGVLDDESFLSQPQE